MTSGQAEKLLAAAKEVARNSYSPYSKYAVGAALLADDGTVITGCNVENASYGLTNCAERTAIFKAVSEGRRSFRAIAIAGGRAGSPATPCGACRQVIAEFCSPEMPVICGSLDGGDMLEFTAGGLLPSGFDFGSDYAVEHACKGKGRYRNGKA